MLTKSMFDTIIVMTILPKHPANKLNPLTQSTLQRIII